MIYTVQTKKALKICFEAHQDAVDKGGCPYVFHPFHLAEMMKDEDSVCVALLHDVLEDTELTSDKLVQYGFSETVVDAVVAITRLEGESYKRYIARVSDNEIAKKVKIADLLHNSDTTRLDEKPSEKELARCEKYREALEYLLFN